MEAFVMETRFVLYFVDMNTNQKDIICRSSFLPHQMILSMQPVTSAHLDPFFFLL